MNANNSEALIRIPIGLHPDTRDLVVRFAESMAEKLHQSEAKYGWTTEWTEARLLPELCDQFHEHVKKGDPVDVANFCAFLWNHGERTTPQTPFVP